jgi:AraC-like DNA-binding protein
MNKLATPHAECLLAYICFVPPLSFGVAAWPAALIVWTPGFVSTPHRHPAMQLTVALNGSLRIRGGRQRTWRRGGAAVIRSNTIHEIDSRDATVVLAYVHAQSKLGNALNELLTRDITCVKPALVSQWRDALGSEMTRDRVNHWVTDQLLNGQSSGELELRLQRVLTNLRSATGSGISSDVSLKTLAASAGLSPSRFLHVFRQEMGVPLRPYIRWLRLQQAVCHLLAGAALSTAAHHAGFSDAAHMSRTFRGVMGIAPRDIVRAAQLCRAFFIA